MFYIDKKQNIHVSRGDSCVITTSFYFDDNNNGRQDNGEETHILTEGECVVFTVKSKMCGEEKIKRILTERNYVDGVLSFNITPQETLITPEDYEYSFLYLPEREQPNQAYTYAQGIFEIAHSVSTYQDIGK